MTPKPNLKTGKAGKCLKKERKALGKRGAEVPNSVFNHWRAEQKHRKRRETGDEAAMAAGGGGGGGPRAWWLPGHRLWVRKTVEPERF